MKSLEEIRAKIVQMEIESLDEPEQWDGCEEEAQWTSHHDVLSQLYWVSGLAPILVCYRCREEIVDPNTAKAAESDQWNPDRRRHPNECRKLKDWRVTVPLIGNCSFEIQARSEKHAIKQAKLMSIAEIAQRDNIEQALQVDEGGIQAEEA